MTIVKIKGLDQKSNQEYLNSLYQNHETVKQKVAKMKEQFILQEINECSFRPKINDKISKFIIET